MPHRLAEFQRNSAYTAFMVTVVSVGIVYLVKTFKSELVPLIWAAFFALPLEQLASQLNQGLIFFTSIVMHCGARAEGQAVCFRHTPGVNRIILDDTPENRGLLRNVNFNFQQPVSLTRPRSVWKMFFACCQRRVQIKTLGAAGGSTNCVRENQSYFVRVRSVEDSRIHLRLFLDQGCREYPAVLEEPGGAAHHEVEGTLEVDKTSPVSWFVSVLLVMVLLMGVVALILYLFYLGCEYIISNKKDYEKGVSDLVNILKARTVHWVPPKVWDNIKSQAQDFVATSLPSYLQDILSSTGSMLFEFVLFVIYLLFWLSAPIPVSSPVVKVFKSYLLMKSFVCLLFASLMSLLLMFLQCGAWPLFFIIAFVLNFIPEIGSLAIAILSVPAVLLDGSVESFQRRVLNTVIVAIAGVFFKVLTGNVIELYLYTKTGNVFMRMHSFVLLGMIMIFGAVLGASGMFLSVPIIATFKYWLVSSDIPPAVLDPLLCVIEGDDMAPHKNYIDKKRPLAAPTGQSSSFIQLPDHGAQLEARPPGSCARTVALLEHRGQ